MDLRLAQCSTCVVPGKGEGSTEQPRETSSGQCHCGATIEACQNHGCSIQQAGSGSAIIYLIWNPVQLQQLVYTRTRLVKKAVVATA
jgi:hypothetical protein